MAVQPPDPPDPTAEPPPEPSLKVRSYASILSGQPKLKAVVLPEENSPLEYYKGYPSISFSQDEINQLARPYRNALVGKFDGYRPPLVDLRRKMATIGFKGHFQIGLLDTKHVLLQFVLDEDYQRCWLKGSWNLGSVSMRIIQWSPEWTPESEPPIAPVWVELVGLPIHFFEKTSLQRITRHLGPLIKLDQATECCTRPSTAKVSIAINLLHPPPDKVWIVTGTDKGFWQPLNYHKIPLYCIGCSRIGHAKVECPRSKESTLLKPPIDFRKNPLVRKLSVWKPIVEDAGKVIDTLRKSMGTPETREAHPAADSSEMTTAQTKRNQGTIPVTSSDAEIFSNVPPQNQEETNPQGVGPTGEQINNVLLTTPTNFFGPSKENSAAELLQHYMTEQQKQKENACPTLEEAEEDARPTEEETNKKGVGLSGEQTNNQLWTPSTNDFDPSKEKNAAELIQQCMSTEQQKLNGKNRLIMEGQIARPTEEEVDTQLIDEQEEFQEDAVPREQHNEVIQSKNLDGQMMEEITNLNLAKELQKDARPTAVEVETDACQTEAMNVHPLTSQKPQTAEHAQNSQNVSSPEDAGSGTVAANADTVASHADTVATHADTVADTVANIESIPPMEIQFMEAIDNYIYSEKAQEIQMEALDLAGPRQKITKGHMELRKLDINATRMEELLKMVSIGTGVSSRLRSKDGCSMMDSIGKTPLEYIEEMNQIEQMKDTDEDTEEFDYMDERARQWEVNIGSSRRRALQNRRKANKIAARGNTLISKGKCHAYEVKRRGGSKN